MDKVANHDPLTVGAYVSGCPVGNALHSTYQCSETSATRTSLKCYFKNNFLQKHNRILFVYKIKIPGYFKIENNQKDNLTSEIKYHSFLYIRLRKQTVNNQSLNKGKSAANAMHLFQR